MSFDSAFFIGCFLPLAVALYYPVRNRRWRSGLLLAVSLVFYAFGSLQGLALLLAAAAANFLLGLLIQAGKGRRQVCAVAVCGNLAFLGAFKYLDFLLGSVFGLPEVRWSLAAPVGISFFTFKCISYIVDTCRCPEKGTRRFSEFLLYISFFPQVTAGPITRFSDFQSQLVSPVPGEAAPGLRRFVIGLGKKLLLAGTLAKIADGVFALEGAALDFRLAWLGAIAYTLQIYFDFSGYSDMAIGLGQVFGFRTLENFQYPYIACSITEFWRRWHISLSGWFRDYLYIPLGGNRKGKLRTALNKALVFTLCGLWHGGNWTFLLWGLWHGLLSALESLGIFNPRKWPKALGHLYTMIAVCLGFVMFRAGSVAQGFSVLGAMFTGFSFTNAGTVALHGLLSAEALWTLAAGAVLCLPWTLWLKKQAGLQKAAESLSYPVCFLLFLLCLVKLAAGGFAPFIYFQF